MMNIVAVIGLGNIAKRHRKNLKLLYPNATVVAISASGRAVTEPVECADLVLDNITQLIHIKPELAIIASPSSLHEPHASALIKNNIPVLIEKPLTSELESADRILSLTQQYLSPVAIGYCMRYLSSAVIIQKLLSENFIGEVYNCSASVGQYLPDWRPDKHYTMSVSAKKSLGGGALLELSHELDYLHWLLGPLELNYAQLRSTNELALDVEEIADLILTSKKGTVCYIHMDFIQKQAKRECTFIGSKGRLDWNLITNTITSHNEEGTRIVYSQPKWDKNQMYLNMVIDFISSIQRNEPSYSALEDAHQTIALINKIKQEADWGTRL